MLQINQSINHQIITTATVVSSSSRTIGASDDDGESLRVDAPPLL